MRIEVFANYQKMTGDAYVMDYTQATASQRKVCITQNAPEDIAYFHLINVSVCLRQAKPRVKDGYVWISIPEHSHRAPFTAFQNTQDELLEILEEHKVKLLGYNEALILNEGYIKTPKEKL